MAIVAPPPLEQPRAGGPEPLQADVLMQAHAAHLGHCAAECPDRDAEFIGEICRIDRSGWIGGDIIVDLLYEPDGSRACTRGAVIRQRANSKQIVEREQQALLEMRGDLRGFEHMRLDRRDPQDVKEKLSRVEMSGGVRDAYP
ncbi:hypothetical protein AC630_05400 [Bradyrhizobium sp. AS23.2]|nr:hypothetical protein AC630_05400 [Bradyrhizobium sp. AS23.2]